MFIVCRSQPTCSFAFFFSFSRIFNARICGGVSACFCFCIVNKPLLRAPCCKKPIILVATTRKAGFPNSSLYPPKQQRPINRIQRLHTSFSVDKNNERYSSTLTYLTVSFSAKLTRCLLRLVEIYLFIHSLTN